MGEKGLVVVICYRF